MARFPMSCWTKHHRSRFVPVHAGAGAAGVARFAGTVAYSSFHPVGPGLGSGCRTGVDTHELNGVEAS